MHGQPGRRASESLFAVLTAGLGLLWLVYLAIGYSTGSQGGVPGGVDPTASAWGFDLAAYLNAARHLVEDGSLYAQRLISQPFEPGPADLFYYAPPLGVAMLPFTGLDVDDAAWIWWALRIAALGMACGLMPVRPAIRVIGFAVVAFTLPGLKDSLLGNVSLLVLLPLVIAWRWIDRPMGSVALAAAMSVRPGLGVFLFWQLCRRQWRAATWTIATGIGLILVTLPFVGVEGYRDFLAVLGNLRLPAGPSENLDSGGLAIALGADGAIVSVIRLMSLLVASTAILVSIRRDRESSYMVTLSASLLLMPLLWDHYLVTLVIPAAFLAQRSHIALIFAPLLTWFPFLSPFLVGAMMLLPFLVRKGVAPDGSRREAIDGGETSLA
jgi:hypothetical protein